MSVSPYPLEPIHGPFGGGSTKSGFSESSQFANDSFSATANLADWLIMTASAGSVTLVNGQAVITTAASNDMAITRHSANYTQAANRDLFYEVRCASSDADANDLWLGFYIAAITNIIPDIANVDGIGFIANGDDGQLDFLTGSNSGTGNRTSDVYTILDGIPFTVGIKVLGSGKVEAYVNGAKVATHTSDLTPSAALRPIINIDAAGATTDTLTVDWFRASSQEGTTQ
jgi:hypothetical protein